MSISRRRSDKKPMASRAVFRLESLETRALMSVDVHRPRFLPNVPTNQAPVIVDLVSSDALDATRLRPRHLEITADDGRMLTPNNARLVDVDGDGDLDLSLVIPRKQLKGLGGAFSIRVGSGGREIGVDSMVTGYDPGATAPAATLSTSTTTSDGLTLAPIDGQYIVRFKDSVATTGSGKLARQFAAYLGGSVIDTYSSAMNGFLANLSPEAAAWLAKSPKIASVEQDQAFTIQATQTNATWGLDRIDQANLPLSTTYTYNATGTGVTAYVIDTGIRLTHNQFGGRAISGTDLIDGGSADDGNGHGTHVAGTIGGSTYGVAKNVSLVAVRVLNNRGSGTTSGVIAGVDWVTSNHVAGTPAVANMSLGGGISSTLDTAVRNAILDGVTFVVAAGNSNVDAGTSSPARVTEAITVAASDSTDTKASFSNYGSVVDIFAPGVNITSAWRTSNTATNTISGTSMASPHVAGVAALYLELHPTDTPAQVASALIAQSTKSKIKGAPAGTTINLLYSQVV